MALLDVRDLSVVFSRKGQEPFTAVDGVSFSVDPGQTVGLVGESGCGKSVTSLAIMRLLPKRGAAVSGSVTFDGSELLTLPDGQMRDRRGSELGMVFQDPLSSLNPVVPIGLQVTEVLERHRGMSRKQAQAEAAELLDRVGIPDPSRRLSEYPHQLSGGMRQRALIAIALACRPRLLIADEPTTAVDVTVQRQLLEVLAELKAKGTGIVMITHDLGVARHFCDDVVVMYAGRVVERASTTELLRRPRHPYAAGLLASSVEVGDRNLPLEPIPGSPPDLSRRPEGCAFHPRCARAELPRCQSEQTLLPVGPNHEAACWKAEGDV